MTNKVRAQKVNDLLKEAHAAQVIAKDKNGYPCFTLYSIKVLIKLQYQITKAFQEIGKVSS